MQRFYSKTFFTLLSFVLLGFILRAIGFWEITFGYDQSRDMLESMKIITSGDWIKIQGPMTDIPGLFHGSLYWYILAPFVYLANGGPEIAKVVLILINLSCIPLLYFVTNRMFGDKRIALVASFIFAISFEATQYGRWMSNPSPAIISTLLSMYGLWLMTRKDYKGILWFLFSWPFSLQFQFVLAYQSIFFILILLWNFRLRDILRYSKITLIGFGGAFLLVSPFIAGLVKYRFQSVFSLFQHLTERDSGSLGIVYKARDYFFYSVDPFSRNLISITPSINIVLFVIFLIFCCYLVYKDRERRGTILFLLFWIFAPFVIYATGSLSAYFLTIGNLYGYILIASYILLLIFDNISKSHSKRIATLIAFLIIAVIAISNISMIYRDAWNGEPIFSVQDGNTYNRLKQIVDYTYADMEGGVFGINSVSNPLFINTTWAYIYGTYGKNKYGYTPYWYGIDVKGRFGDDLLEYKPARRRGDEYFLLVEPDGGIPIEYIIAYQLFEDQRSDIVSVWNYYDYTVEKRVSKNESGINFGDIVEMSQTKDVIGIRGKSRSSDDFEQKYKRYIELYRNR